MLNAPRKRKKVEIVFEDDHLLAVNKPAGLVTLNVSTNQAQTLEDWVKNSFSLFSEKNISRRAKDSLREEDFWRRCGIVHRLDKPTSGLILIAKDVTTFQALQQQFKQRKIQKIYWALAVGKLPSEGAVKAPLGRLKSDPFKFGVVPGGKTALTEFSLLRLIRIGDCFHSLVEVRPKTGRTHQIRVHFKYLGNPLFGDQLYGGKKEQGRPLFLVAKEIKFKHPVTGKILKLTVDLPTNLFNYLNTNG